MEELGESELGTQEYWDERYKNEVHNFRRHGDVGEIWFGDDIVDRIIRWINNYVLEDKNKSILDIGCGNGMLLVELYQEGYKNLKGVDYSQDAITLAKEIAVKQECNISFDVINILKSDLVIKDIDIILDKGTYDAISLSTDAKNDRDTYITTVYNFLTHSGVLVITSCNWTKDELCEQFQNKFELSDTIPTPQFKFGGKVGNVVSSVVFKKKI